MTSLDFNFAEPIASSEDFVDAGMNVYPVDIGAIQRSNVVVLNGRPMKVVEITHSKPGKHGHSKVHLIGIDIFTGRRTEDIRPCGHAIQVVKVDKKDYLLVFIDDDNYATLMAEDTCKVRNDIQLKADSDMTRRLLSKYDEGNGQIKITVLKALGEEQIMAFKVID